jgi:hypothetical protein
MDVEITRPDGTTLKKQGVDVEAVKKIIDVLKPLGQEDRLQIIDELSAKLDLGDIKQIGREVGRFDGFREAVDMSRFGTAMQQPDHGPSLDEFMSEKTPLPTVAPEVQQVFDGAAELMRRTGTTGPRPESLEDFMAGSAPASGARIKTNMTRDEADRWLTALHRADAIPDDTFAEFDGKKVDTKVLGRVLSADDDRIADAIMFAKDTYGSVDVMNKELSEIEDEVALKAEIEDWLAKPMVMQKPQGSAWHKIQDATRRKEVFSLKPNGAGLGKASVKGDYSKANVFVIEHDWAAAFEGSEGYEDTEVRLPYGLCVFELRLSGRRVCTVVGEDRAGVVFVSGSKDRWVAIGPPHTDAVLRPLISTQVAAICIALDAKVAETNVERAPSKLNQARAKKGLSPLKDYHVVSLLRRSRPAGPRSGAGGETGRRVRLHFRRGHWRRYGEEAATCTHAWGDPDPSGRRYCRHDCGMWRTWVNWMLVGNPDLGFIDKHYKL